MTAALASSIMTLDTATQTTMPNGGDPLRALRSGPSSAQHQLSARKHHRRSSSSGTATSSRSVATAKSTKSFSSSTYSASSSSSAIMTTSPTKNDKEHRARFLNKLGIYGKVPVDNCPAGHGSGTSNGGIGTAMTVGQQTSSSSALRIQPIPTDPATARKMNMLRGMGVGGIRTSSDEILPPNAVVPVNPRQYVSSRPSIKDVVPVEEPLKWKQDDMSNVANNVRRPKRGGVGNRSSRSYSPTSATSSLFAVRAASAALMSKGQDSGSSKTTNKTTSPRSPSTATTKPNKKGHLVQFSPSVAIIPIPMRTEYSSRIKHRLWSDRDEIRDNANRNVVEFAAEGWDWHNVVEDDEMFVCTVSGELVHPVHCQDFYRKQDQENQEEQDQDQDAQDQGLDIEGAVGDATGMLPIQ